MTDILVVEDNRELGELLCDFLRAENYTVSLAQSGERALELYERALKEADRPSRVSFLLPRMTACYRKLKKPRKVI